MLDSGTHSFVESSAGRSMASRPLKSAYRQAQAWPQYVPLALLRKMCRSKSAKKRLLGLMLTWKQIEQDALLRGYLTLAQELVEDPNNDCRWQALIVIGEFIQSHPAEVWKIVCKYGDSEDEDMRTAVACVLLEDLLEYHDKRYRKRVEKMAASSPLFAWTYDMCWDFSDK